MASFIDKAKIKIASGAGGNGALAWRREKYVDKGGPAGGDGGNGGDVYFIATSDMSTLLDFTHKSVYKAERGENGQNKNCHGKNGESHSEPLDPEKIHNYFRISKFPFLRASSSKSCSKFRIRSCFRALIIISFIVCVQYSCGAILPVAKISDTYPTLMMPVVSFLSTQP